MDRRERKIKDIFKKFSSQELIGMELQDQKIIYNVVGFLPVTSGNDNRVLISNLGCLLAKKGLNVCIVDFKVFYPDMHLCFSCDAPDKGHGLMKLLKSDQAELKEEIIKTNVDNLYLLTPSPLDDFEEYYDFKMEQIERVIDMLKSTFDIVLMDIPNNPPLEFCLASIKYSHVGFLTCNERNEATRNIVKLFKHLKSIGISTAKFINVLMLDSHDLNFDYKNFEEHGLKLVGTLPFVKSALRYNLDKELYILKSEGYNKKFVKTLNRLADTLAEK